MERRKMIYLRNLLLLLLIDLPVLVSHAAADDFFNNVEITWGGSRGEIMDRGGLLQLSLDKISGSGFQSKQEYLFGRIDMQIKVVPDNSAGTVTAYYLSSQGDSHDEIDFEFLGNLSGEPYTLHTNIYSQGKGNREQQFQLWFDPRLEFHTYTIIWNPTNIIWYVDNVPIRVFRNVQEQLGVPYPEKQPQRVYSSLWNGDSWATRGGLVKIDWSQAPFTASYRNFQTINACVFSNGKSLCRSTTTGSWRTTTLDVAGLGKLQNVRRNNMIYDYCSDTKRFPHGLPLECSLEL
ncbi:xyloglucan endotransglycosylase, family GH16 [Zostera marina]|uniref:Xyloglucan endotransglucosylase/hydrolase n=1 Tax=Zostera marina TaxID=29655 RepID=A0A0K9PE84_ZOSMR|nr:xyloglucan endotransglycosylase, family GH16 [Zostera marina]